MIPHPPMGRRGAGRGPDGRRCAPALAQDPPARGRPRAGRARRRPRRRPARPKPRGNAPVGLIVPYPFPPALIIRQTPEAHDEVQAFLNMLRYH